MRQSEALAILGSGASVFLTGAPGAGKTYVLNEFIRQARADGASVAVTASTGIAATHINGTTIHSWSGIGLATALTDNLVKTVRTRRKRRLQEADILIIDEVSMLHAWLFDMVDRICRIIRRDERPFGGLQVVLSGDFFQLPPVSVSGRNNDLIAPSAEYLASRERYMRAGLNPEGFVTESLVWRELNPVVCYLTEQHRQDDGQLLNVLTDIREGAVDDGDRNVLLTRLGAIPEPGQQAVNLFPVNRQADALNDLRLFEIKEEPHEYLAESEGAANLVERLKKNMLAPERLCLKTGAAVMAVRNDTDHIDVYAAASTVYELIAGVAPYEVAPGTSTVRQRVARHRAWIHHAIAGRLADRRIRKRQHRHHEAEFLADAGRRCRARHGQTGAVALRVGHHHPQIARHDTRSCRHGFATHIRAGHGIRGAVASGRARRPVSARRQRAHVPGLTGRGPS